MECKHILYIHLKNIFELKYEVGNDTKEVKLGLEYLRNIDKYAFGFFFVCTLQIF